MVRSKKVDILKIDVQGAELDVLRGRKANFGAVPSGAG